MKKAGAISLLMLFLVATAGYTVNRHYCGGQLRSVKVIAVQNEQSCCGVQKMAPNCCRNEILTFVLDEDYRFSAQEIRHEQEFVAVVYDTYRMLAHTSEAPAFPYDNYSPPLLQGDLPVLHQSFLI